MISLILRSVLFAQVTGVNPSSCAIEMVASGPVLGPAAQGCSIAASGTGAFTLSDSCFGGIHHNFPSGGTLPATIKAIYTPTNTASTCTLTVNGASSSTATVSMSVSTIPRWQEVIGVDMAGSLLSALGWCSADNTSYRFPNRCTPQGAIRPGGNLTVTPRTPYTDATFGGVVIPMGSGKSREYFENSQVVAFGGQYYHVAKRVSDGAPLIECVTCADSSQDYTTVSSDAGIRSNSAAQVWADPDQARYPGRFYGITADGTTFKSFYLDGTPPGVGSVTTLHVHSQAMSDGVNGSGNRQTIDGLFVHMNGGSSPLVFIYDRDTNTDHSVDTGFTAVRNVIIGPRKSNTTGLYYISVGTNDQVRIKTYSFNRVSGAFTLVGQQNKMADGPTTNDAAATWEPGGNCTYGTDCWAMTHRGAAWALGEPMECSQGIGRTQRPSYTSGGGCVGLAFSDQTNGRKIREKGGGFMGALSPLEGYYVTAANAPLQASSAEGGSPGIGQGITKAWRIDNVQCSSGAYLATLDGTGDLNPSSGWTGGSTGILVDGVAGLTGANGRFTLTSYTDTTFTYGSGCTGGPSTTDTGSVTEDASLASGQATGGIMVCRHDNGYCRMVAHPLAVSYGTGGISGPTGTWGGISTPGYNQLSFPTLSPDGRMVCWSTNYGYSETYYYACALTGFDLGPDSQPWHFDRYGRGLDVTDVTNIGFKAVVKPTSAGFSCTVRVSARPDFATFVSQATNSDVSGTREITFTGLSTATEYYVSAKCGSDSNKVWDYGTRTVRIK